MRKRFLSALLALCLALALLPGKARAVGYPAAGGYIGFSEALGAITACDPGVTAAVILNEINGIFSTDKRDYSLTKNGDTVIAPDSDLAYQAAGSPDDSPTEDAFAQDDLESGSGGNDILF